MILTREYVHSGAGGGGWSNLWAIFPADRWAWFIRTELELNTKSHPTDLTSALIPAGILVARDLSKSLRAPRSFLLALPAAPSDLCLAE
jgi:hypothetical protein